MAFRSKHAFKNCVEVMTRRRFPTIVHFLTLLIAVAMETRMIAQTVSMDDIADIWKSTVIEKIKVEFDVLSKVSAQIVLPPELGGKELKRPLVQCYRFQRVSDLGMRLDQLTSPKTSSNLLDGKGILVSEPSEVMEGLSPVAINLDGSAFVQTEWTTECMLYWTDPLATKAIKQIASTNTQDAKTTKRGELDVAVLQIGDDYSIELAKQFDWRPVRIVRGSLNSKRGILNRTELLYSRSSTKELQLERFTTQRFISGKEVAHLTGVVTERELGLCSRSDIELQIPKYSFVTDTTGAKEMQYIVRKDGSMRLYDESIEPFAKNWTEIINSTPPSRKEAAFP